MTLGAAPDMTFGPHGKLAQFVNGGMIVARDLIGKGQIGRVEDTGLGTEMAQQARRLLRREAGIGTRTQRAIEEQNARCMRKVRFPREPETRPPLRIACIQRRETIGIGQCTQSHDLTFARPTTKESSAASGSHTAWLPPQQSLTR